MTPHIIRDPDDLNDYDVDTLILDASGDCSTVEDFASSLHDWPEYVHSLPAVVIATGEQVRAARKALEEDSHAQDD